MAVIAISSFLLLGLLPGFVTPLTDPALPGTFFPFGTDVGDSIVPVGDDKSSPAINIPGGFTFFAQSRTNVYVSHLR